MIRWTEIHSDVSLSENRPEMGKLNKNIDKNCIMDLKTGIAVLCVAMLIVSMAIVLAVMAIPTAPVTTTDTQVCGGGDDGDLWCNWAGFAYCVTQKKVCTSVCALCIGEPSKLTCAGCAVCAGYCAWKNCYL